MLLNIILRAVEQHGLKISPLKLYASSVIRVLQSLSEVTNTVGTPLLFLRRNVDNASKKKNMPPVR